MGAGRHDEAARLYVEASERAPGNHELMFWAGLSTVHAGDLDAGVAEVQAAIELQPSWRELLRRLPADAVPSAAAVLARLGGTLAPRAAARWPASPPARALVRRSLAMKPRTGAAVSRLP